MCIMVRMPCSHTTYIAQLALQPCLLWCCLFICCGGRVQLLSHQQALGCISASEAGLTFSAATSAWGGIPLMCCVLIIIILPIQATASAPSAPRPTGRKDVLCTVGCFICLSSVAVLLSQHPVSMYGSHFANKPASHLVSMLCTFTCGRQQAGLGNTRCLAGCGRRQQSQLRPLLAARYMWYSSRLVQVCGAGCS
ncbi:hypothetical protein COO60DRAFT_1106555 [Scenedesmus sp. NREL 46B-D3]|nr:hypothetical protein COO60DRAFT_1106555 [Scenedesmus sp. NREL 46B-D3]